jgi:uncharacterized protein (TIGR03437 family)
MKRAISVRIIPAIAIIAVACNTLHAQKQVSDNPVSCYSSLLSGSPPTLSANVDSISNNGTVVVNGADTAEPTTPFQWAWGDGSMTSGFFPQQHVYGSTSQNYVVAITATENNGSMQQFSLPVFFVAPLITAQPLPGVSFQIPSAAVTLSAHWSIPPTDVQPFPDSSFPVYSRSDLAYILAAIDSIDYDFVNQNSFLLNGVFSIDMFELTSDFVGGESFWNTTPMSVGYSATMVGPSPQWYILFNEIGKDATLNTPQSLTFGANVAGDASEIYEETLGDIFSYASGCQLISNASLYGIGGDVALDIRNSLLGGAAALQSAFNAYVADGAPFSSWNPNAGNPNYIGSDPTLGTLSTLAWKFIEHAELQGAGYEAPATRLMALLQLFNPSMLARYAPQDNTEAAATFRSTLLVAAISYAFSEDLRSEFEALNFPIDDATFEQLYEMASGGEPPPPPPPSITAVVNGADFKSEPLSPGAWISILGQNLGQTSTASSANTLTLGGASVSVCRIAAVLNYNSGPVTANGSTSWQINALVPDGVAEQTSCAVVVTVGSQASAPINVAIAGGILELFQFTTAAGKLPIVTHANYSLVGPVSAGLVPAKPNETVIAWATGDCATASLTVSGISASVAFSGRVAPGLCQVNFVVPGMAPAGGDQLSASTSPNTYTLWVSP